MPAYAYDSLSSEDLERLARDLLSALLGVFFESFGPGPDGGIDGIARTNDGDLVIQCKHYPGDRNVGLERELRRERTKVEQLRPARYLLVTSQRLTPRRKQALATLMAPWCQGAGDVFGRDDLDALLRDHPHVLPNHPALWGLPRVALQEVLRGMPADRREQPAEADWSAYLRQVVQANAPGEDAVALDVRRAGIREPTGDKRERILLDEAASGAIGLVVVAPAGAGKSEMLRAFAGRAAADALASAALSGGAERIPVPVYVEPRGLPPYELIAHALGVCRPGEPPIRPDDVRRLLGEGRLLLVLDDAHRLGPDAIRVLLDYQACGTRVVIGSRPAAFLQSFGLPVWEVAPLTASQSEGLVRRWSGADDTSVTAAVLASEHALASRPMGLRFLFEAYGGQPWSFGRDRADLFGRVLAARLQKEADRLDSPAIAPEIVRRLLGRLAIERLESADDPYGASPAHVRQALHRAGGTLREEDDPVSSSVDAESFVRLGLLQADPDPRLGTRYAFAHDQWHEYFAACELVRTGAPIGTVQAADARREVVRFAASLFGLREEIRRPEVWDRFWGDLAAFDIALAFEAMTIHRDRRGADGEHVTTARDHIEALDGVPAYTAEQALGQFRRYLVAYRDLIGRHVPLVKPSLDPKTEDVIGLWIDGHDLSRLPHHSEVMIGFVPQREGEPDVAVKTPLEHVFDGGRVGRPLSIHSSMIEGVPRLPIWRALGTFREELRTACARGELWDPPALLQERAYYQATALIEANTRGRVPLSLTVDAEALGDLLGRRDLRSGMVRSHQVNVSSRRVDASDLERTLRELDARGLASAFLAPPLPPPWALLNRRHGDGIEDSPFTAEEVSAQLDWAVRYLELVYQIRSEVIELSFPTAFGAIDVVGNGHPVHVLVSPLRDRPAMRPAMWSAPWSPVMAWAFFDSSLGAPVVARRVESYDEANAIAAAAGRVYGNRLQLSPSPTWPPLRIGVYSRLRSSLERFLRRR